MRRKTALLALLALLTLALAGCAFNMPGDTLYRLPHLPSEYESLETQIDALLADGAEHVSPTAGSNLQSVQMVDLDGDGTDEAVAFFRREGDDKPLKIDIFRAVDNSYELTYRYESSANSLYSIAYTDLDGNGVKEILAGVRSNLDVQTLCVLDLGGDAPRELLAAVYARYVASDMDADGRQELILVRSDEEGAAYAECYVWNKAGLQLSSSLHLSMLTAEVSRLTVGTLSSGESALFVSGVTGESGALTDILTAADGLMQNVGGGTVMSGQIVRFSGLYPTDINNDGITEVPEPSAFSLLGQEGETYYRIFWRQFDASGAYQTAYRTLYNTWDGWELVLPEQWDDTVNIIRTGAAQSSTAAFYMRTAQDTEPQLFLTITAFTGENRESQAAQGGRFLLARQVDAVYAAQLLDSTVISEEAVKKNFGLITAEWTSGEN